MAVHSSQEYIAAAPFQFFILKKPEKRDPARPGHGLKSPRRCTLSSRRHLHSTTAAALQVRDDSAIAPLQRKSCCYTATMLRLQRCPKEQSADIYPTPAEEAFNPHPGPGPVSTPSPTLTNPHTQVPTCPCPPSSPPQRRLFLGFLPLDKPHCTTSYAEGGMCHSASRTSACCTPPSAEGGAEGCHTVTQTRTVESSLRSCTCR